MLAIAISLALAGAAPTAEASAVVAPEPPSDGYHYAVRRVADQCI